MQVAGVILCGGESRRMGRPKAMLPFGSQTVLARIVLALATVADPIVLVRRPQQQLPPLPAVWPMPDQPPDFSQGRAPRLIVAEDIFAGLGPLAGMHAAFVALQGKASHALVVSCDVPLIRAAFLSRLMALLEQANNSRPPETPPFLACVPITGQQQHPLVALYACDVLPVVERLLQAGRLRPAFLLQEILVRWVEEQEWQDIDPDSLSLFNINTPADYEAALRHAT